MKKLLTLLFITVSLSAFCQNVYKYPTYWYNDLTVTDSTWGNVTRSPIFNFRNDYGRYFQNFRWSSRNNTFMHDSISFYTMRITDRVDISDLSDNGYFQIDIANGGIQFGDLGGAITDARFFLNIPDQKVTLYNSDFETSSGGGYNIGSEAGHWDTAWIDHIHNIYSGVYKPDTSAGTDITAFTIDSANYTRVGDVVTVNGYISSISTGISGGTIRLSLPIASNLARVGQLTGVVNVNDAVAGGGAYIVGHVAADRAVLTTPPSALSTAIITYTFSYLIY